MDLKLMASGHDPEVARHWDEILKLHGIEAVLEPRADGVDVLVPAVDFVSAKNLFANPFEDEIALPTAEAQSWRPTVRQLEPEDRTEVLARTPDMFAAQRLAEILDQAGLYVAVDASPSSSVFAADGLPSATITIATKQRDQAFRVLESFARENTHAFDGAANIDPAEVVEALLLAPLGVLRVRGPRPPPSGDNV